MIHVLSPGLIYEIIYGRRPSYMSSHVVSLIVRTCMRLPKHSQKGAGKVCAPFTAGSRQHARIDGSIVGEKQVYGARATLSHVHVARASHFFMTRDVLTREGLLLMVLLSVARREMLSLARKTSCMGSGRPASGPLPQSGWTAKFQRMSMERGGCRMLVICRLVPCT